MQSRRTEKIIHSLVSDKKLVDYIQSKVESCAGNYKVNSREYIAVVDACIEAAFEELNIVQLVVDHYAERNRRKRNVSPQNDIPELTFSEQEPRQSPQHHRRQSKRQEQEQQHTSHRKEGKPVIDLNKTHRFSKEDFSHTQLLSTDTSLQESSESTVEFNRIPKEAQVASQKGISLRDSHDSAAEPNGELEVSFTSNTGSDADEVLVEDDVQNGHLDESQDDPWNEHVASLHETKRHTYSPHSDPFIDDYYEQERPDGHSDQVSQLQQDQINREQYSTHSNNSQQYDEQNEEEYASDFHAPVSEDEVQGRHVRFPDEGVVSELIYSRYKYTPAEVAELFYTADEAYYFQMSYEREAQKAADVDQDWNDWIVERIDKGQHSDDEGFDDWEPAGSVDEFEF